MASQPTISHNVSATNAPAHPLGKRDDAQDFHDLVCKGDWLINAVIKRTTLTGSVWKESDLDAAYYWDNDESFQPSPNILPALQELGIPHGRGDVHYVEINQNMPFKIGGQEYVSSCKSFDEAICSQASGRAGECPHISLHSLTYSISPT